MPATPARIAPEQGRPAVPGEVLTRRAVTVIAAAIVVMAFAFGLGNVTRLCLELGITAWIAWLVGPAVDLSVVGLLAGMRYLSLQGYTGAQLRRHDRNPEGDHRARPGVVGLTSYFVKSMPLALTQC